MYNRDKYVASAELRNGKSVFVEPDFVNKVCRYQYFTEDQLKWQGTAIPSKKGIWLQAPIYDTVEQGVRIFFITVEATPIALTRIREI